jgi:SAM-dependent methyltransferase
MPPPAGAWNHNIHYYPLLLGAAPRPCARALDVGCGEGLLTAALRRRADHVTGIDVDAASVERARHDHGAPGVEFVVGDVLTHPFAPASFDLVVSCAALHHMDEVAALSRMRDLLRPGGALAVVGLARSRYPADLPRELAGVAVDRVWRSRRTRWESSAPTVWPPERTYREVRDLARRLLPGALFRHRLMWRYSVTWTKPGASAHRRAARSR